MSSPSSLPNATPVGHLFTVGKPSLPVASVNGQQGYVVLSTSDVGEGTNLYFTDARALAVVATQPNPIDLSLMLMGG